MSWPLLASAQPQACRSISSRPAPAAARSIMRAKPAVVNGDPRSLTKTKGKDCLSGAGEAQFVALDRLGAEHA
jgi:hypothetical protein